MGFSVLCWNLVGKFSNFHCWVVCWLWVYCIVPGGSDGKESACNAESKSLIPGSGRSSGEGNGYPLQYSGLENSMDREAWQVTVMSSKEWDATECYYTFIFVCVFIILMYAPCILTLIRVFIINFFKMFFCSFWDYHVVFVFPFASVMYPIV